MGPARIAEQVARVVSSTVTDEDTMHPVVDEESHSEHPSWEVPEHCRRETNLRTARKRRRALRPSTGRVDDAGVVTEFGSVGGRRDGSRQARLWKKRLRRVKDAIPDPEVARGGLPGAGIDSVH